MRVGKESGGEWRGEVKRWEGKKFSVKGDREGGREVCGDGNGQKYFYILWGVSKG